ncbi:MAG: plastocyanin/azurin family copper-binding protein [Bryobacteraceae bacterium]
MAIDNFKFSPDPVTISAGTPVVWTNRQDVSHTVVADKNQFSSSVLDTGETFQLNATTPGTYAYHCSIHPFMKGTIVVK